MTLTVLCLRAHLCSPRHIQQQSVQILINIQVVCFLCLDQAQDSRACTGSIYRVMEQKVLSSHNVGFYPSLSGIVGNLTSSVQQIVHECFLMIESIVHCLLQFASSCWRKCFKPAPEFFPDLWLCLKTLLFALICRIHEKRRNYDGKSIDVHFSWIGLGMYMVHGMQCKISGVAYHYGNKKDDA